MPNDNLDKLLEKDRPTLSQEEKAAMLREIETRITAAPVPTPYYPFAHSRKMVGVLTILALIVGTTGTVAASGNAKPGDLLFPIERAAEEVQLAFASESRAAELRVQFSAERLAELREIIAEETDTAATAVKATSSTSSSPAVLVHESGEARIAKAITAVLDSLNDYKDAEARTRLLEELQTNVGRVKISGRDGSNVRIETEDHARIEIKDDRIEIKDDGFRLRIEDDGEVRVRIEDTTDSDEDLRGQDSSDDFMIDDRGHDSDDDDDKHEEEYEFEDNDDWEDEYFNEDYDDDDDDRRGRGGDDDDDEEDDWDDDDSRHDDEDDHDDDREDDEDFSHDDQSEDGDEVLVQKFEVRVKDGEAEVRLELDNDRIEYETNYTSRAALVAEVAARSGLSAAVLSAVLDLEIDD